MSKKETGTLAGLIVTLVETDACTFPVPNFSPPSPPSRAKSMKDILPDISRRRLVLLLMSLARQHCQHGDDIFFINCNVFKLEQTRNDYRLLKE